MRLNVSRCKRLAGAAAAAVLRLGLLAAPALADAGFERWVAGFRATAAQSGVSGATYDRAFRGITEHRSGSAGKGPLPAGIHRAGLGLFRQPRA